MDCDEHLRFMTIVRNDIGAQHLRQPSAGDHAYRLEEQVGFVLRKVSQRHAGLFAALIGEDTTPMQWAVIAKLAEAGPLSQNLLGRETAMDAATVKGVVDRLLKRGMVVASADPMDQRLLIVSLSAAGKTLAAQLVPRAEAITEATLAPLSAVERRQLLTLLAKLS
jgi:DNA-binding MarR family transcriptional regulator